MSDLELRQEIDHLRETVARRTKGCDELLNQAEHFARDNDRLKAALAAAEQRAEVAEKNSAEICDGWDAFTKVTRDRLNEIQQRAEQAEQEADAYRQMADHQLECAETAERERDRYYAEWNAREARIERLEQACYQQAKQAEAAKRQVERLLGCIRDFRDELDEANGTVTAYEDIHPIIERMSIVVATAPPEPAADPLALRAALGAIIPTADLRPPEEIVRDLRDGKLPKPAVQEEE